MGTTEIIFVICVCVATIVITIVANEIADSRHMEKMRKSSKDQDEMLRAQYPNVYRAFDELEKREKRQ